MATPRGQRGHHFWHAVSFGLPREPVHEWPDYEPAERGEQYELRRPEALEGVGDRAPCQVGDRFENVDERDRPEPGEYPDDDRQDDEVVLLGENEARSHTCAQRHTGRRDVKVRPIGSSARPIRLRTSRNADKTTRYSGGATAARVT